MATIEFNKKHLTDFENLIRKYILPYNTKEANRLYAEVCKAYNRTIKPHCPHFELVIDHTFFLAPTVPKDR